MKRRGSGNRWFSTWELFLELPCVVLLRLGFAEVWREGEQWAGCAGSWGDAQGCFRMPRAGGDHGAGLCSPCSGALGGSLTRWDGE